MNRKLCSGAFALLVAAGSVSGQTRTGCSIISDCFEIHVDYSNSYTVNSNDCDGFVAPWAAIVGLEHWMQAQGFPPPPPCDECPPGWFCMDYEANSDGKDEDPPGCVASAAALCDECAFYGANKAEASWGCSAGSTRVEINSRTCALKINNGSGNPACIGNSFCLGSAGVAAFKIFEVDPSVEFESTASVDVDVTIPSVADSGYRNGGYMYLREGVTGAVTSTPSRAGLYGFATDGSVSRLGYFTDSAFDPTSGGSNVGVSNSGFTIGATSNSIGGGVEYSVRFEAGRLDGKVVPGANGDYLYACRSDRQALYSLLGTSYTSASYNPRADLNMDGTITTADLAIFNGMKCNANWDCSTTPPVLNTADFTAYLQSYAAADADADIDGAGGLNVADYTAFLNAYAVGCHH